MKKPEEYACKYADSKGFLQQKQIFKYIEQGNRPGIEQITLSPKNRDDWEKVFGNNLKFACTSLEHSWSQTCLIAMQQGISEREISDIFLKYQQQLQKSETIKRILDLNAEFNLQLVDCVSPHKLDDNYSPIVQRCRAYIYEHIRDPINVASVATAINYSRSYLSHIYRQKTGNTVYSFIQQEKLELAKQFLLSSSYHVAEIWKDLGFCSQSHFTFFFKKMTDQTPSQFRQYSQKAVTVDTSEINSAELMLPSFMQSEAEDNFSEKYQEHLKCLCSYAEDIGFKQEVYLLYCVKKGRAHELETELNDPTFVKAMNNLFENNRTLIYETLLFLLPQIYSAAVDGGISMKIASQLYRDFFARAHDADVQELIELNKEAFVEFALLVADKQV